MSVRPWESWEDDIVAHHYPDVPNIMISLPWRTLRAIRSRASLLKVAVYNDPFWTIEEQKTLIDLHPDMAAVRQALPHRTSYAIQRKIAILGLAKRNRKLWTTEREEVLKRTASALNDRALGAVFGVSISSVQQKRARMGLKKPLNRAVFRTPIVGDIRREADRRGIKLGKITKALGCQALKSSLPDRKVSWTAVTKVVAALGGSLYVEWND